MTNGRDNSSLSQRLHQRFEQLNRIGLTPSGGVTRLAFSAEEVAAHDLCRAWMEEAGLTVRRDSFGNLIGRRQGRNTNAPVVMTGSHVDTVPNGGKYDGVVGVLAGIEALQFFQDHKIVAEHPLEVIVFVGEESSRFGLATMGSRAISNLLPDNFLLMRDKDGVSTAEAMAQVGLEPAALQDAVVSPSDLEAFVEVHVEQGRTLHENGHRLGIVTACTGTVRYRITFTGEAQHSGSTTMKERHDALVSAAQVVTQLERLAKGEPGTVATAGTISVSPNAINVVPGEASLGIDIRSVHSESLHRVCTGLKHFLYALETQREVRIHVETLSQTEPIEFSPKVVGALERAASKQGYDYHMMPSAAGHDAMNMATITHTSMLFLPSVNGISHNPKEFTELRDMVAGTEVLIGALAELAGASIAL